MEYCIGNLVQPTPGFGGEGVTTLYNILSIHIYFYFIIITIFINMNLHCRQYTLRMYQRNYHVFFTYGSPLLNGAGACVILHIEACWHYSSSVCKMLVIKCITYDTSRFSVISHTTFINCGSLSRTTGCDFRKYTILCTYVTSVLHGMTDTLYMTAIITHGNG
jgi:hypothetical protein